MVVAAPSTRVIAGRYQLEMRLGFGGFGAVWRARDRITDAELAIKVMAVPSDQALARERRELAALRLVLLPGVVRLLDDGVEGSEAWIAMELLDGSAFLEGCGPWEAIREDVDALLDTLGALHRLGIVHGDLKPANLILVPGRGPVVLDFGIARGRAIEVSPDPAAQGFSRSYAAPEQLRGEIATVRSDLYSLGVMLFEHLSGTRVVAWRAVGGVPSLAAVVEGVPPEVVGVVDRLLAASPDARPADADEVRRALGHAERSPSLPAGLRGGVEGLRELFHGPERLLHLPTDAATELVQRAGEEPSEVARELHAWVRAGLARWEGDRVRVRRGALDRLAAGVLVGGAARHTFVAAAGAAGLLREPDVLRAAAREDRLAGRRGRARARVLLGLEAVRERADESLEDDLLAELLKLGLAEERPAPIGLALYEMDRTGRRTARREALWQLAHAAQRITIGSRAEAADRASRLAPFEDEELECWRASLLVLGRDVAALAQAEDAVEAWAPWSDGSPLRRGRWLGWLGTVRYQQGRFAEAAALHSEAADAKGRAGAPLDSALASRSQAAAAWLDAGRWAQARSTAREVELAAAEARLPALEAFATAIGRSVSGRLDEAAGPDVELVEAGFEVAPAVGAMLALCEASIAWRTGAWPQLRGAVNRAVSVFSERGNVGGRLLLESLSWALGPRDLATADRLATELDAVRLAPGLRAQVLGLLVSGRPELAKHLAAEIARAVDALPTEVRALRRELLSLEEVQVGRPAPL